MSCLLSNDWLDFYCSPFIPGRKRTSLLLRVSRLHLQPCHFVLFWSWVYLLPVHIEVTEVTQSICCLVLMDGLFNDPRRMVMNSKPNDYMSFDLTVSKMCSTTLKAGIQTSCFLLSFIEGNLDLPAQSPDLIPLKTFGVNGSPPPHKYSCGWMRANPFQVPKSCGEPSQKSRGCYSRRIMPMVLEWDVAQSHKCDVHIPHIVYVGQLFSTVSLRRE